MPLSELSPEQITAFGVLIAGVLGALGWGAKRSASTAPAPVKMEGSSPGAYLILDAKQVQNLADVMGLTVGQVTALIGAINALMAAMKESTEANRAVRESIRDASQDIQDLRHSMARADWPHRAPPTYARSERPDDNGDG